MNYMTKQLSKISKFFLLTVLISGWIFSGWPPTLSRAQETTSTPPDQAATSTSTISDLEIALPEEELPEEAPPPSEPPQPQLPPLKEYKYQKEVRIDKSARHSCVAKSFTADVSGRESIILELELRGARSDFENIEIGSLPAGIDITFLDNANYEYQPKRSDSGAVLQITNQSGSQKGNFSIPIIYISGNSTTICQINIINF
mgnify:CR=1 FL=1